MRLGRFVIVALVLVASGSATTAGALAKSPATTAKIDAVRKQVLQIKRSSFATPGKRAAAIRGLSKASAAVRKRTCASLRALDATFGVLNAPASWKRRRIPPAVTRRAGILSRLTALERLLARAKTCKAQVAQTVAAVAPNKGGGKLTPIPVPFEAEHDQGEGIPTPAGVYRPPGSVGGGLDPGADPYASPPGGRAAPPRGFPPRQFAPRAVQPLAFFRSSDVGQPPRTVGEPHEPTTATGGGISVFTGNGSTAFSNNAGLTWKNYDPSTLVPDSGRAFCCDQSVAYSKSTDLFVWLLQYRCAPGTSKPATTDCNNGATGGNRLRIAVASPKNIRDNWSNVGAAWTYWDLPPTLFGEPGNAWFDRGDISVNANFLNLGVDILRGASGHRSLLVRTSLAGLVNRRSISLGFITDSPQRMQVAQGEGTSWTYFVGSNSLSQARLWDWAPWSGTLFRHDINHASVPVDNGAARGSDGADWHDRWGTWPGGVESATVANGGRDLVLAQATGRDNNAAPAASRHVFDRDALYISRFNTSSWTLSSERWLWNSTLNFGYPALATAASGEVGISFVAALDNANPRPIAGFLNPSEQFTFVLPASQPQEAGDYYSLRPGRTPQSFVMPVRTIENDGDGATRTHWRYLEYGHGTPFRVFPPVVTLLSPANGSSFPVGTNLRFVANVSDPQDTTIPASAIVWRSDGVEIGRGTAFSRSDLPVGDHVIRVTATDAERLVTSAQVTINVQAPRPPVVTIGSPVNNATYVAGANVHFAASVSDPQGTSVPPNGIVWSADGAEIGRGAEINRSDLSLGDHLINVTATDTAGLAGNARVTIHVVAPPPSPKADLLIDRMYINGDNGWRIFADVRNAGNASAPATVTQITPSGRPAVSINTPELAAGATTTVSAACDPYGTLAEGTGVVDATNLVDEISELNNTGSTGTGWGTNGTCRYP